MFQITYIPILALLSESEHFFPLTAGLFSNSLFLLTGKSKKLGLSGRPSDEVGLLATSKLYMIKNQIFAFMPQVGTFTSRALYEHFLDTLKLIQYQFSDCELYY